VHIQHETYYGLQHQLASFFVVFDILNANIISVMLTTTLQHRRRKPPPFFSAAAEAAKPNFSADFRRTLQKSKYGDGGGSGGGAGSNFGTAFANSNIVLGFCLYSVRLEILKYKLKRELSGHTER